MVNTTTTVPNDLRKKQIYKEIDGEEKCFMKYYLQKKIFLKQIFLCNILKGKSVLYGLFCKSGLIDHHNKFALFNIFHLYRIPYDI